jgi:DNA-binding transcriptional LysR family regulator
MNIHHLELFYYVARHGGISEAARNMPYGIQQPAISGQIIQLEERLGVTLFQRRPFALTDAGRKLYEFIAPFFSQLDRVEAELHGDTAQLRVGASEVVLRDHLPVLIQNVRKEYPQLKIALREGYQPQLEAWLERREIDLAITVIESKPMPGLQSLPLLELPLVLLAVKDSKVKSAEELWKRDRLDEPLICLPAAEAMCKRFQEGLARLKVDWFPSMEASSLELVETYVAHGFGIGLSVAVPRAKPPAGIRQLPLQGFAPIVVGVLWHGRLPAVAKAFLEEAGKRARTLTEG